MEERNPRIDAPSLRLRRNAWTSDEDLSNDPFRWYPYSAALQAEEIAPGVRRAPIIYGEFTHPTKLRSKK